MTAIDALLSGDRAMRVMLVTLFFPPERNAGTENYTLGLARAYQQRGHTVKVLCAEDWTSGEKYWNGVTEDTFAGVPVCRIHLNWSRASDPNRMLYDSPQVEQWLDGFLARERPDVVHITSVQTLGAGVLRSVKRAGISLVLTLMDFWFMCPRTVLLRGDKQLCDGITTPEECMDCLLLSSNLYRRTLRAVPSKIHTAGWSAVSRTPALSRLRGARGMAVDVSERKAVLTQALTLPDVVISHSSFVQRTFARAGYSDRILHVPNGHDLSWTREVAKRPGRPLRFGYVGQIVEVKGVHVLLAAFRQLLGQGAAQLDIWGDLDKEPDYVQRLYGLSQDCDDVRFRGLFRRNQLADVWSEIDVLVVPSLWYENAPLVIQEAFATGTPVIATDLGGMAEAVSHEVNGLLFAPGSVDDLAGQLRRVIEEPDLLRQLQAGIPVVKTIEEEVAELEALYCSLAARTRSEFAENIAGSGGGRNE